MQPYRLGIDIGTASVACAAFALDGKGVPTDLIDCVVRIFEEPLGAAGPAEVGPPKKAARRIARQQRRQNQRRSWRLRRIAALAKEMNVDRASVPPGPEKGVEKGGAIPQIHQLRAKAAESVIPRDDLLRVFLHLAKRRGYMGVFRQDKSAAKTDEADAPSSPDKGNEQTSGGKVRTGVADLKSEMKQTGSETLGQYLLWRLQNPRLCAETGARLLALKDHKLYADKGMVEDEFNRIWETQAKAHPELRKDGLREKFHAEIFHKRPLRSTTSMVGRCELEPDFLRAPMAHPAAQEFRIEQAVSDLRFVAPGMRGRRGIPLDAEQKQIVRNLLRERHNVDFDEMARACPPPEGMSFNAAKGGHETYNRGDKTAEIMRDELGLADQWNALDEKAQTTVINLLAESGGPEFFQEPDWHENIVCQKRRDAANPRQFAKRRFPEGAVKFINAMAAHSKFNRLQKMGFDSGRAAHSVKAMRKLSAAMREHNIDLTEAKKREYPGSVPEKNEKRKLEPHMRPPRPTGNTVADVALRQFQRTVNDVIERMGGPPAEVVVELSRDMALGLEKREEIGWKIDERKQARKEAAERVKASRQEHASPNEIKRYMLWQEQDHEWAPLPSRVKRHELWRNQEGEKWCPYCGKGISLADALDGGKTNYEHILPRSLTRISGRRDYLVLAHRGCNDEKKNLTPWQAWHPERGQKPNPVRWAAVESAAQKFREREMNGKAKMLLFEGDAPDNEEVKEFSDRQLNDTSWIAKTCRAMLERVCQRVFVSRGKTTAHLRDIWGLNTVIPELRYRQELPVLDEDGAEIPEDEFKESIRTKKWRRRPGKRIDHRHHMMDAIVIGLTSPGLFAKLAENYRERRDNDEAGLDLRIDPPIPMPELREKARERAADLSNLTHRPDPGRTAKPVRMPLHSLVPRGESAKRARAKISRIADPQIREAVLRQFDKRLAEGAAPENALDKGAPHPANGALIRRVLLLPKTGAGEQLFDQNAYAERTDENTGKTRLARRHPISALTKSKAGRIVDEQVRNAVLNEMAKGATVKNGLRHPKNGTFIRRVLCFDQAADTVGSVKVSHRGRHPQKRGKTRRHAKRLNPLGYAWLEVDENGNKELIHHHEAAEGTRTKGERFHKSDTVMLKDPRKEKTGDLPYVVRQFLRDGKGRLVLTLATESRPVGEIEKTRQRGIKDPLSMRKIADLRGLKVMCPQSGDG